MANSTKNNTNSDNQASPLMYPECKLENTKSIINSVRHWLESFVIELNLCPFAKKELVKNRIRYTVSDARDLKSVLTFLHEELSFIHKEDSIETSLLIFPLALTDFDEFNHCLDYAEKLIQQLALEGIFQIASFHPDYQFADTHFNDAENYTNRSPYPILHILREQSLENAIDTYPNVDDIPQRNIDLMNSMGQTTLASLFNKCFDLDKK